MIIGLVGAPSSGKSTFFKASTLAEVEISSRPFTTISKNEGIGYVKIRCIDEELGVQCNPRVGYCHDNNRFVPIDLIDVAGLVPGAHEGKGRGNEFLDDLNSADALIHVIDISGSTNESGEFVGIGKYDPSENIKFLENELDMWYFRVLNKNLDKFLRKIDQEKSNLRRSLARQLSGLKVNEKIVEDAFKELEIEGTNDVKEKVKELASLLRKKTKPMLIVANKVDIDKENNFERIKEEFKDYEIIPCSSESELALKEASKKEFIEYIPGSSSFKVLKKLNEEQEKGLEYVKVVLDKFNSTGVQEALNYAVFNLLNYIAIFPAGAKLKDSKGRILADCFLLRPGSTALDFAYKLHTDIGDKFVKAVDVRSKRAVAKDYKLKHRDGLEILTS